MTAAEESVAGRDHGAGVTGAWPRPASGQVDIAGPGDVEAMMAAACQLTAVQAQRVGTDRAAQVCGGRRECPAPRSERRNAWVHRNVPSGRKDDQPTAARSDTGARMMDSHHKAGRLAAARLSAPPQTARGRLK
jgi:hypothetical protein